VTSSLPLFEAAMVKSTHVIKSCFKIEKKYGNKRIFLHKSPSERSFRHRIHRLLRRADARGIADIIYRIWRISLYLRVRHSYWG